MRTSEMLLHHSSDGNGRKNHKRGGYHLATKIGSIIISMACRGGISSQPQQQLSKCSPVSTNAEGEKQQQHGATGFGLKRRWRMRKKEASFGDDDGKKKKKKKMMMVRRRSVMKGGGEEELCKKRILMGEKCRALTLSGVLHYDENGVLLTEELDSFI
ncbi:hypothetical protein M569_07944 [Genlisea aurea]|uniref:Uncharacterized protein n=1 Tax=Genlisea aurea TaxID=192259 RepID=S8CIM9_9LAMI|nr:hypothetical protein M569_07944 [Genlisea aurea]